MAITRQRKKAKRREKKVLNKKKTINLRKKMTKRLKYKKNDCGCTKKLNMRKLLKFFNLQKGGG